MTALLRPLKRLFNPAAESAAPVPAGLYHYQSPPDDPRNYRLHLRMEEHGGGVLILNASVILHLNQTAAEYAYYLVKNSPVDEVAQRMSARYDVPVETAANDYRDLSDRIRALIDTPDLDPVQFLDMQRQKPFSGELTAPYRLDCALTYRLSGEQAQDSAPIERVGRELNTAEWCKVMDKAWDAGIPHVVFTGGESTLRDDLPDLIAHAEALGQVSGLLTDGLRLADEVYLGKLLNAGLDHMLLVLHPEDEQSWQALGNALVEDLALTTHITVTPDNTDKLDATLERLWNMGARQVSLSATDTSLAAELAAARNRAAAHGLALVWNLPVPYSALHPVALEAEDAQMEGAGRAWLYVEPDGDVRPAQGDSRVLGNLLHDSWSKIWKGG